MHTLYPKQGRSLTHLLDEDLADELCNPVRAECDLAGARKALGQVLGLQHHVCHPPLMQRQLGGLGQRIADRQLDLLA